MIKQPNNSYKKRHILVRLVWIGSLFGAYCFERLWQLALVLVASFIYIVLNQDQILYGRLGRRQRKYIRNPTRHRSPAEWKIPSEFIKLRTDDNVSICAWFMTQYDFDLQRKVPTILCLHGNSGNIGHELPRWASFFRKLKVNLLVLEYRGYGESEGEPSEHGLYLDAKAGLEFLLSNPSTDNSKIFVYGQSLGGAVAVSLAADINTATQKIKGLIIENTFLSVSSMAERVFLPLRFLPDVCFRPFLRSQWRTRDTILRVKIPTLFLSGLHDHLVGPEQMRELYKIAKKRLRNVSNKVRRKMEWFVTFEAGHGDLYLRGTDKYFSTLHKFLKICVSN